MNKQKLTFQLKSSLLNSILRTYLTIFGLRRATYSLVIIVFVLIYYPGYRIVVLIYSFTILFMLTVSGVYQYFIYDRKSCSTLEISEEIIKIDRNKVTQTFSKLDINKVQQVLSAIIIEVETYRFVLIANAKEQASEIINILRSSI